MSQCKGKELKQEGKKRGIMASRKKMKILCFLKPLKLTSCFTPVAWGKKNLFRLPSFCRPKLICMCACVCMWSHSSSDKDCRFWEGDFFFSGGVTEIF